MRGSLEHILLAIGETQEGKPIHVSAFQAFGQITSTNISLANASHMAKLQIEKQGVCTGEERVGGSENTHLFNGNPIPSLQTPMWL